MSYHIGGWESKWSYGYNPSENRFTYVYKDEWNPTKTLVVNPIGSFPDTAEGRAYQKYSEMIAFRFLMYISIILFYDEIILLLKWITRGVFTDYIYELFININILIVTISLVKKAFHIIQKERNQKKTEVRSEN